MTLEIERIYNDAVKLNPIERVELIEMLYDSFSKVKDKEIETGLNKELHNLASKLGI